MKRLILSVCLLSLLVFSMPAQCNCETWQERVGNGIRHVSSIVELSVTFLLFYCCGTGAKTIFGHFWKKHQPNQ